jgi:hypothetical protein
MQLLYHNAENFGIAKRKVYTAFYEKWPKIVGARHAVPAICGVRFNILAAAPLFP